MDHLASLSYSLDADVAGLTMAANGSYSFDAANKAYQSLGVGDFIDVVANYTVTDEHQASAHSTLTIRVFGTNDIPTAQDITASINEDGPAVQLKADFKDVDAHDSHTFSVDVTGTVGKVNDNGDGTFNYDTNGKFNFLGVGQSVTDTFKYTVDDGHGGMVTQTATVTINGQNDAPTAESWTVKAKETDSKLHDKSFADVFKIDLLAKDHVGDVDQDDHLIVTNVKIGGQPLPSYITLDNNGVLSVDLNSSALDYLKLNELLHQTIDYTIQDGNGGIVTNHVVLDITGTADKYGDSVSQTITKTDVSNGQTLGFDLTFSKAAGAFDFSGTVKFTAFGDFDASNEQAFVLDSNKGDLIDTLSGSNTVFLSGGGNQNTVDKNGQPDGYPEDHVTLNSGAIGVSSAGMADGHVTFSGSFSGQVDADSTLTATLTYEYWA